MIRICRIALLSVLLCIALANVHAQKNDKFTVQLKSGNFIPVQNASTIAKQDELFRKATFAGNMYLIIQFKALPDENSKKQMHSAGIELIDYLPNLAYTAIVRQGFDKQLFSSFNIRSVFQLTGSQKAAPGFLKSKIPAHAVKVSNTVDVTIITYNKLTAAQIIPSLRLLNATIVEEATAFRSFVIRIQPGKLKQLVALPFIQWIEFVDPPNQIENTQGRTLHGVNILNDGVRNLKGDGINVGIWDEGAIGQHVDFSPASRITQVEVSAAANHSTHCAGIILGRGLINPIARGMAPNAQLFSYNFNGNVQTELAAAIPTHNLAVSSHSYGSTQTCGVTGAAVAYTATSRATDINLNNFPNHLHVHSAGNSQTACAGGWSTITSSGKSAKNNILVAAITSTEAMTTFSSFGPVQDGRVKPEISAFGSNVFSTTTPANTYGNNSGTSMATPGVAGSVALLVQRFKQLNAGASPISTLIKNAVLNTAHDLGNTGPDYKYGYGRINALPAVEILENNRYLINSVSTGGMVTHSITIPAGTAKVNVMLTWNDPAGTANANPALVNNLDLLVVNGATNHLPWILDPNNPATTATKAIDNVSNIEQVTIENPAAGTYEIRVAGTAVAVGPQQYALTWTIDQPQIKVHYPNGTESFNPGTSEMISWENSGVTGNQTVEFSLDNGTTWTTISSSVGANTNRLAWNVPTGVNTSTALIRISSGTLTDVSDATFKILGTTTGLAASSGCVAGNVAFTWNGVLNASNYDLYQLDATGNFITLATNLTGTTYEATGLTPGASMWFAIVAKNSTTGAISERSIAINAIVSSGGGGLGVTGNITGSNVICGNQTTTYTIAPVTGATTYVWTIPPGANIVSGQGTTTLIVNYAAGSSNGNVSVYASNGSCQTAAVVLPVTVSSSSVAAPVAGGNQTVNDCPPTPTPTLTATATVPAGNSVVWYNAATAGTVVANPVLNTVGTITYYAAAVSNSSACQSETRTPVVLTINPSAPAVVTNSGPVTFCQGSNVVLSANTGSGYLWSNGSTSQSITVSSSGTYSVQVSQAGGCTSTSPATVVTVNTNPAANVTASGVTEFCQGDNVTLTASAGSSYLWSNGATTQSIIATTSGNYSVTVTNASSCSAVSAATTVSVSPSPVVNLSASPYRNLYPGLNTSLTASVTPPGNYSYTWFKNGQVVPGASTATLSGISINQLGSYSVKVTNINGLACSDTSAILKIADSATSKIFIYPNPNFGQFNVSYYTTGSNVNNRVMIYDSKGALVYSKIYSINTPYQLMEVDLRKYSQGVYRVVLFDRNGKRVASGSVLIN